MVNEKKVAIVGCGFVGKRHAVRDIQGLTLGAVLVHVDEDHLGEQTALHQRERRRRTDETAAEGEALDIAHGMTFAEPMKIYAGDYSDVADAAMIVVTAGAAQKPGETRLDLVNKNVSIFKSIIPEIKKSGFDGILLIVSNPVDVLTYAAI